VITKKLLWGAVQHGTFQQCLLLRTLTGRQPCCMKPIEISVPMAGAEQLRLITTDAGDGISCDHATWAMARLER